MRTARVRSWHQPLFTSRAVAKGGCIGKSRADLHLRGAIEIVLGRCSQQLERELHCRRHLYAEEEGLSGLTMAGA